jgi:hypothetical protein
VPSQHGHQSSGRIIQILGDVSVGLQIPLDQFAAAIRAAIGEELARQIGVHSKMLEPMLGPSD